MEARVPTFTVIRIIARKEIKCGADRDVILIARHGGDHLELGTIGPHPHHATTIKREALTIGALGSGFFFFNSKAKIAHRNIEPPVDTHATSVGGVISASWVFNPST